MALYTLVPSDSVLVIDGVVAQGVDYTGIDPTIHAIQWYNTTGWIEFVGNPAAQTKPANQSITSITPYQSYITNAEGIIYAANNPVTFYALADGTVYNSVTYNEGQALVINTYPLPTTPPTGFTDVAPYGGSSAYDYPQWDGSAWILAPFPIAYNLAQAKTFLTSLVNANASALVNNQVRNYSTPQLFAAASVDALLPADSVSNLYPTVGDYQTAVDTEIAAQLAFIAGAATVNQLYTFDPTVSEPPNYV
jgi:hypothetical protein